MAEAANNRRRRRILEQGSDRLAFISGRIETLPPSSADAPSSSDHPNTTLPALPTTVEDSDSVLEKHDASRSIINQTPPKPEGESEISLVHTSEPEPEPEPESEHVQVQSPTPPNSSLEISHQQQPQAEELEHFIIPSDIKSAINASMSTRLCCSIVMALLVVAYYLGFSLMGTRLVLSMISFKPLYLVLLTNVTVVVARLVSGKQRGFERSNRRRQNMTSNSSSEWDAQLVRTLELGMVMKSVVDAVFMDCAVYAIVLVCGLSLVHT